jgi:hypothetical protein
MKKALNFKGSAGAFQRLRNVAAVLSACCLFVIPDAFSQVEQAAMSGWAGTGLAWIWHPDDSTLFIVADDSANPNPNDVYYRHVAAHMEEVCGLREKIAPQIKTLVIEKEVRGIRYCAFRNLRALENLYLYGPYLQRIEHEAFFGTNIKFLAIPSSVKIIGEKAFSSCDKLMKVVSTSTTGYNDASDSDEIFDAAFFQGGVTRTHYILYTDECPPCYGYYTERNDWGEFKEHRNQLFNVYNWAPGTCHVKLSETDVELTIPHNRSQYLNAVVKPEATENRNSTTDGRIRWWSSDGSVVHVSQTGKISALKAGTATVTACAMRCGDGGTVSSDMATCTVTVRGTETNPNLKSLKVNGVSVSGFNPDNSDCKHVLNDGETSATIETEPVELHTQVSGAGVWSLSPGDGNIFDIVSTAENGTGKTYRLQIVSLQPVTTAATLAGISVNGISVPGFNPDVSDYTVTVPGDTEKAKITCTANSSQTVVVVEGPKLLAEGQNTFSIKAYAENGDDTKDYQLIIIKE